MRIRNVSSISRKSALIELRNAGEKELCVLCRFCLERNVTAAWVGVGGVVDGRQPPDKELANEKGRSGAKLLFGAFGKKSRRAFPTQSLSQNRYAKYV